jgi:hypothetical protein
VRVSKKKKKICKRAYGTGGQRVAVLQAASRACTQLKLVIACAVDIVVGWECAVRKGVRAVYGGAVR